MPKAVIFIGLIFLLLGALAVFELATGLFGSRLVLGLNLLLLPAGVGLLAGREKWRSRAVALIIVNVVALLVMIGLAYGLGESDPVQVLGMQVDPSSRTGIALVTLYTLSVLAVLGAAVWTLRRPYVVEAFRTMESGRIAR